MEDLKGMAHVDILAETGTRRDAEMRHFTGMSFFCLLLFFFLDCTLIQIFPGLLPSPYRVLPLLWRTACSSPPFEPVPGGFDHI